MNSNLNYSLKLKLIWLLSHNDKVIKGTKFLMK